MSNFFKDAYDVTAFQRGFIEFPRELPGLFAVVLIGSLSFLSDIKISIIAQILSISGIAVLGLTTPSFNVMLVFIFINSVGMHVFMPMKDAIGVSLAEKNMIGKRMGQYKGIDTAFRMLAGLAVFIGFRSGAFSFETDTKLPFVIAGVMFGAVFLLLIALNRLFDADGAHPEKSKFVFRKEYKYYYYLVILFGVQKQIMMVYGPWVLIDLLGKKADIIAVMLAYAVFIIDRMSTQMSLVRTVFLKSILVEKSDLTPTLSLGMSMDHFVSIICAYIGGIVWMGIGPQYIFFFASFLSLGNLYVAFKLKEN